MSPNEMYFETNSQSVTHMQSFKEICDMVQMVMRILERQPLNCRVYNYSWTFVIVRRSHNKSSWSGQILKQLRTFMGLANYYRRFVNGFVHIASPRNALTKKGVKFE